jgi:hypothetical protein
VLAPHGYEQYEQVIVYAVSPTDLDGRASGEAVSRLKRSARAPGLQTEGCLPPGQLTRSPRTQAAQTIYRIRCRGSACLLVCGDAPHWASWSRSDEISWSILSARRIASYTASQ